MICSYWWWLFIIIYWLFCLVLLRIFLLLILIDSCFSYYCLSFISVAFMYDHHFNSFYFSVLFTTTVVSAVRICHHHYHFYFSLSPFLHYHHTFFFEHVEIGFCAYICIYSRMYILTYMDARACGHVGVCLPLWRIRKLPFLWIEMGG